MLGRRKPERAARTASPAADQPHRILAFVRADTRNFDPAADRRRDRHRGDGNVGFAQYPYLIAVSGETVFTYGGVNSLANGPSGAVQALTPATGAIQEGGISTTAPNSDFYTSVAGTGTGFMWLAHLNQELGAQSGTIDQWNAALTARTSFTPPANPVTAMTLGSDGAMYVATSAGAYNMRASSPVPSEIFRIDPATQTVESTISLPSGSYVQQLTAGPGNAVWFTDSGLNEIGRVAADGTVHYYPIPTAKAGLAGIAPASDGALWFTESTADKIGRIATDGTVTEYAIPTANADPMGITAGPVGACIPQTIYFTEKNALGKITFSP